MSWQMDALVWGLDTFGPTALLPEERAMRFLEEAIELAQAQGVSLEQIEANVRRVYSREPGDIKKEIAQAGLTLELLATNLNLEVAPLVEAEWQRCQSRPKEEWQRRHAAKVDAGAAIGRDRINDAYVVPASASHGPL